MEFEENIFAKREALSDDDDNISGPFTIVGIDGLPRFNTRLVILQNSRVPRLSASMRSLIRLA